MPIPHPIATQNRFLSVKEQVNATGESRIVLISEPDLTANDIPEFIREQAAHDSLRCTEANRKLGKRSISRLKRKQLLQLPVLLRTSNYGIAFEELAMLRVESELGPLGTT
jgi:hypothetical protein